MFLKALPLTLRMLRTIHLMLLPCSMVALSIKTGPHNFTNGIRVGVLFFHSKGLIDFEATWVDTTISEQRCLNFNLEDKVDFNGGSNVMIQIAYEKIHLAKCNWLRYMDMWLVSMHK